MKQKVLNKFWLRVGMLVAAMTTALSTNSWAETYSYEFTSNAWSENGSATLNDVSWTLKMSGGTISSFDSSAGMHFGTNNNTCTSVSISTSGISGTITSVKVKASRGSSLNGSLTVKIGDTSFKTGDATSSSLSTTSTDYTFTGSGTGSIDIKWTKSSGKGAYYIKSIEVEYTPDGGSTDPSISVDPTTVSVPVAETEGTINVTYKNISTVAAEVAFYAADGETTATYDWIEAEINKDNNVDYVIGANTGEARTAYMKVWAYDDDLNEVYSDLITITQAAAPQSYSVSWTAGNHTEIFVFDAEEDSDPLTSPATVIEGSTIYVSVGADEGYEISTFTVKDDDENEISLTTLTEGSYYSFEMPASNVTITIAATESSETPSTTVSGSYVKVTSTDDLTSGQYLIVYEDGSVAFNGALTELDAESNTISVTISDSKITATDETVAAEFTIDVNAGTIKSASGYYIGRASNANGLDSNPTTTYTNTISISTDGDADIVSKGGAYLRYNASSNQERFRYYKSSSYTNQKAIALYKRVETVTLNSNGYATFATTNVVSFPDDAAYSAWAVTAVSGSTITFSQVTGAVAAGTGVLLKGTPSATVNVGVVYETGSAPESNLLEGVTSDKTISSGEYYGLSGNKFVKVNGGIVPAGKALLPASVVESTGAKAFTFVFNDDPTGIESIETGESTTDGAIYNLAGQRLQKMQKGINIVNGKKILK